MYILFVDFVLSLVCFTNLLKTHTPAGIAGSSTKLVRKKFK